MFNRYSIRIGVASVVALLAGTAYGADPHDPATAAHSAPPNPMNFDWVSMVTALLVFGVAFFILATMVWPKLLKGLNDRDAKIRGEILAAEEARKRADESLKEYERSLAQAKDEANAMVEQARADQTRLAATLRAEAEAELTELRDSARRSIEAAKRAALAELYQEAATLATAVAEKILQREVNERDQARLVEEALTEISSEYVAAGASA